MVLIFVTRENCSRRIIYFNICVVVSRVVRMAGFTNLREVLYNTVHSCLTLLSTIKLCVC